MQEVWAGSLTLAARTQNDAYLGVYAVEAVLVLGLLGFLGVWRGVERRASARRVGRIFLLPVRMLRVNRKIADVLSEIVDYRDFR